MLATVSRHILDVTNDGVGGTCAVYAGSCGAVWCLEREGTVDVSG